MKILPFFLFTLVVGCDDKSAQKASLEKEKIDLVAKIKTLEIELKNFNKKEELLNTLIVNLEEQKSQMLKEHDEFVDRLLIKKKEEMAVLQDKVRKADEEGYKRGVDVMLETYRESNQTSDNTPSIRQKLELIEIPGVQFFNASLSDVVGELGRQSIKFDLITSSVASRGVNIMMANKEKDGPRISIHLNPMPLENALHLITEMIGWSVDVHDDGVFISKPPKTLSKLETEHFKITPELLMLIVQQDPDAVGDDDPFAVNEKRQGGLLESSGRTIREFLEQEGIPFLDSEGHMFSFDGYDLIVRHEREALDRIKRIIQRTLRQTRYDELEAGE